MNELTLREMWMNYTEKISSYYIPKVDNLADYKSYIDFMLVKMTEHKDVLGSQIKTFVPMPTVEKYFSYVKANLRKILIQSLDSNYSFLKSVQSTYTLPDILKDYTTYSIQKAEEALLEKTKDFDSLTVEEFAQNGLLETRTIEGRRYDKGMKVSKFLSRIGFSDRDFASVKFDYDSYLGQAITLSADPADFAHAGNLGESCYSPTGSNRHALVATIRFDQSLVASTYDPVTKSYWRAWVYINKKDKLVFIAAGHPYENQLYQIALYSFFIEKGYKIASGVRTDLNTYLDSNYSDSVRELFSSEATPKQIELTTELTDDNVYVGIPDFNRDGSYGIIRRDGVPESDDDDVDEEEEE